ncbi:MAG: UDP-N-acetylmuramate--L-alanine ligase [Anaerolineae bacterium]|nr:UDP-N-acetylmuramate--L-alanine ligase [Anaerolineae bacterium]
MSDAQPDHYQLSPDDHAHLVGIGGSGMSAIAWLLLGRGHRVTGSDLQTNQLTAELAEAGATVFEGHDATNIRGAAVMVVSSAVPEDNPEVVAARTAGIPVLKRANLLGQLMAQKTGVAVAGTHGKTTTTSLIAQILLATGHDPSVIAGGVVPGLGRNGRAGGGEIFVVEADEYDHMFLGLRPRVAVVTNIEHDHPDIFPTLRAYRAAFGQFVSLLPEDGLLVVCTDDRGVRQLLQALRAPQFSVISYGLDEAQQPNYRAVDLRPNALGGTDFVVLRGEETLGLARLRLPGAHNVRNALAAIAVLNAVGLTFAELQGPLAEFGGVGRRFQIVGEVGNVTIIDDYAHHPTEIKVNLAAARERYPGRRLWAVWQPHTYSRTRLLMDEFAASFDAADRVIVLDIFRSREQETLGVDAAMVVERMTEHPYARHIGERAEAAAYILDRVRPDDVILTLSAGDADQVGQWILDGLRERVQTWEGSHRENG